MPRVVYNRIHNLVMRKTKTHQKSKAKKRQSLDRWQRWEYRHTTLLALSLVLFLFLLDTAIVTALFGAIGQLGYAGILLAGMLFVSVFTAVPAVVLLSGFTDYNPLLVGAIGGAGAMLGDYLILRFMEDKVAYELKPVAMRLGIPQTIEYLQKRRSTLWTVRLAGAFVVASPLPDEIGIGLLGVGRMSRVGFLALCYALNAAGILLVVLAARAL